MVSGEVSKLSSVSEIATDRFQIYLVVNDSDWQTYCENLYEPF